MRKEFNEVDKMMKKVWKEKGRKIKDRMLEEDKRGSN